MYLESEVLLRQEARGGLMDRHDCWETVCVREPQIALHGHEPWSTEGSIAGYGQYWHNCQGVDGSVKQTSGRLQPEDSPLKLNHSWLIERYARLQYWTRTFSLGGKVKRNEFA